MIDETFAEMSNLFVYTAMVIYTLALLAYVWDVSGVARSQVARPSPELVGVGATGARPGSATLDPAEDEAAGPVETQPVVPDARQGRSSRWLGIAVALTWLAGALHLGAVLTRGLSADRVPWANMYEFTLTGSFAATAIYLGLVRWHRSWRSFGMFVVGPVLLALGLAITVFYTASAQLAPALQSPFLVIHVSVAFISVAVFTIAFSVHVLQLVQDWRERRLAATGSEARGGAFMARLPSAATLEQLGYRFVVVGFPLWTFTLVAGAIWAEKAWGRYWGWDPKEIWTFVVWVIYAAYLHARATRGWDGRRATALALAGYVGIIINFTVVNLVFSGQHSYAGIG